MKKKLLIQSIIFICALFIIEVVMRLLGHQPGILNNAIYPLDSLISMQQLKADSFGITSYIKRKFSPTLRL